MDLHSTHVGANEMLDNHGVLITLVLNEDGLSRVIDGASDALAAVTGTPDQMRGFARVARLPLPVRFETLDDFLYFLFVRSDDGVVASFGKISRFPVQRFYERARIVDDHGFFVGHAEIWVAVFHVDAGGH